MKPIYVILLIVIILAVLITRIAPPEQKPVEPTDVPVADAQIVELIEQYIGDADISDVPHIIVRFDMPYTLTYHADMTALRIIESVCALRSAGYQDKSMRFIAEIGVVRADGSQAVEDGMNAIFYPESASNLDCTDVRAVASETWLGLMDQLAGNYYIHPLVE